MSIHGSLEACLAVRKAQEENFLKRECRQVRFEADPPKQRALDLFSGTGSVTKVLQEVGYRVTSLDFLAKYNADLAVDILEWQYWRIPPGTFEIITASPPCTEFSQAKRLVVGIWCGQWKSSKGP